MPSGSARRGNPARARRLILTVVRSPGSLAFDHDATLADAVERTRGKLEYTTLAAAFCKAEFTVGELRRIYEITWGTELDPRNFHRKLTSTEFLEPTGEATTRNGGRPAALYRVREGVGRTMSPPLMRPN